MSQTEEVKSEIDPREVAAREYLLERADKIRDKVGGYVSIRLEAGRHTHGVVAAPKVDLYIADAGGWVQGSKFTSVDEAEAYAFSNSNDKRHAKELRTQAEALMAQAAKLEAGQ